MISVTTTTQNNTTGFVDDGLDFIRLSSNGDPIANELLDIPVARKVDEIIVDELNAGIDLDKVMDELVEETREVVAAVPKLRFVNKFKIIDPPLIRKEDLDIKNLDTLAALDPKFTDVLGATPKNYMMETYVIGLLDGYASILEKEHLPTDLLQQIKDLKDISMRKDKIAAMQKWDVIAYNIEGRNPPTNQHDAFADLKAVLKVFKKIFFTELNLY